MRGFGLLVMCAFVACTNEGTDPPVGRLNFPSAVAVSGNSLFVASSNFTLRYNAGALHRYDLTVANTALRDHCGGLSVEERDLCGIVPEEDPLPGVGSPDLNIRVVSGLLTSEVLLGSYATGMAVLPSGDGARVYMPVRSDANLSFVDVDANGCFSCGGVGNSCDLVGSRHTCSDEFRRGNDDAASTRNIALPADPVGLAVGPATDLGMGLAGNYVITAHRGGRVSLFLEGGTGGIGAPYLVHTLEGFPNELVSVAVDPVTQTAWLPNATQRVVSRVGVAIDDDTRAIDRSYLYNAGQLNLLGVDTGGEGIGDTRAIRFDPRPEVRRAYILSRRPRALLSVEVDESYDSLSIRDIMEVGVGPTRLDVRHFPSAGRTLAFVSCFDSRDVYVLDVDQARLVGIVRGMGGAFELTTFSDGTNDYVYVLDFQASAIRVLDLAPMFECLDDTSFGASVSRECSPQQLGFIGRPLTRQELI
ncbi:MAG: hypothetical protein ACI9KE_005698 [Polyangiales bacterium]|jgi:hypothetical protein